ncbi:hypothetical protein LDENG_00111000 [Lucifuga dentata]|nr:hypothetical protein LDENG_00111000 [Lucifuga dentata]
MGLGSKKKFASLSESCDQHSSSTLYDIQATLGEGRYGTVMKCVNKDTSEVVAVKFLKKKRGRCTNKEIDMLNQISALDPDKHNLVQFNGYFVFEECTCLEFEMLDKTLATLLKDGPLSLPDIQYITQQLLVAFDALKSIGVIHTDLKSDNVMLINHKQQPFKVKLIDFGLALAMSEVKLGIKCVQPLAFRAPEVLLGLPITEAIDMWSLGMLLIRLFTGHHMFRGKDEYDMIKCIVDLLGQPEDDLLNAGLFTKKYFREKQQPNGSNWCLKTPGEYLEDTATVFHIRLTFVNPSSLDSLIDCEELLRKDEYQPKGFFS